MIGFGLWLLVGGLSTVSVELPYGTPQDTVAQVVGSCNAALGAQRCVDAHEGRDTRWRAQLRFVGPALEIRLVGLDGWLERRTIRFSPADATTDRFTAAGLVVAALLAAQPEPSTQPHPSPQSPIFGRSSMEAPVAPTVSHSPLALDGALHLSPGLLWSSLRWGGELGLSWTAFEPRVGLRGAVRYLGASMPLELRWVSGFFGGVVHLTSPYSTFDIALSAEAMVERVRAAASRGGDRESAGVTRWGGRFGARLGVGRGVRVRPWIGCELTLLAPAFEVRLRDASVGVEGPLRVGVALGVTFFSAVTTPPAQKGE